MSDPNKQLDATLLEMCMRGERIRFEDRGDAGCIIIADTRLWRKISGDAKKTVNNVGRKKRKPSGERGDGKDRRAGAHETVDGTGEKASCAKHLSSDS
jgi:hypothetical protein